MQCRRAREKSGTCPPYLVRISTPYEERHFILAIEPAAPRPLLDQGEPQNRSGQSVRGG